MQSFTLFQLVLCFALTFQDVKSLYRDDACNHKRKNLKGVCKLLDDCPSAIKDLESRKIPQNCGFEGNLVIVCCTDDSSEVIPPTKSPTTAPTTPSTISPTTPSTTTAATKGKIGEKSERACKSYEKFAIKEVIPPILIPGADPVYADICPWDVQALSVIVEGEKCDEGEFPHMALIGYGASENIGWKCGGSLISDRFILTAAHCSFSQEFGNATVVRLGDLNRTDSHDDKHVQQINIKDFLIHPDYSQKYNDIALVELETPVKLNLYVKPACLYPTEPTTEKFGIITGWGDIDVQKEGDYLLKAVIEAFAPERCNKTYRKILKRGIDPRIQLCYGSTTTRRDACQGDSGGPIQVYTKIPHCSHYVFGVTSFGRSCGQATIPGVYVNVFAYLEWIEKIVWP